MRVRIANEKQPRIRDINSNQYMQLIQRIKAHSIEAISFVSCRGPEISQSRAYAHNGDMWEHTSIDQQFCVEKQKDGWTIWQTRSGSISRLFAAEE